LEAETMTIIERVKNICLTPKTEWPVIAGEPTSSGALLTGYVAPLAAVGAAAGFVGLSLIGQGTFFFGTFRLPIVLGLVQAVISFVGAIVAVFVVSLIINALAPSFGAEKNSAMAMKVAAYSYTPALAAGVLRVLPALGTLVILAALYGLYLLYLGLQSLMKSPQDKAVGYTAVVVVCAIACTFVVGAIGAGVAGAGALGAGLLTRGALGGGSSSSSSEVQFDKNSTLGKLQELGKKMEESNKKIEAAEKSGDTNAQAAAAIEGLGALLGGGRHVDPMDIDQLKPFVPDTFAGLPKKSSNAEKNGIAGLMVSKAEATYGDDGQKRVTLEVSDTGGVSGLMGLATWVGVQGEKDDDSGTERTQKVNGRLVHERTSKRGGDNEFGIVLGERFMVSAKGTVDLNTLKAAVQTLDLAKLESMKDVGVQK
jgi:hypothetical protein